MPICSLSRHVGWMTVNNTPVSSLSSVIPPVYSSNIASSVIQENCHHNAQIEHLPLSCLVGTAVGGDGGHRVAPQEDDLLSPQYHHRAWTPASSRRHPASMTPSCSSFRHHGDAWLGGDPMAARLYVGGDEGD